MGYFKDLREHIAALDKAGLLIRIDEQINKDRDEADASPFPAPEEAATGVFLDNSVKIPFKYGGPKVKEVKKGAKVGEASNVSHYK